MGDLLAAEEVASAAVQLQRPYFSNNVVLVGPDNRTDTFVADRATDQSAKSMCASTCYVVCCKMPSWRIIRGNERRSGFRPIGISCR